MKRILTMAFLIVAACTPDHGPRDSAHISAASALTDLYSHSSLGAWNVRGHAAGDDCAVLFIETSIVMEDSMVEALHYGAGSYDIYRGGVQEFSRQRAFRGVAYKDGSGRIWIFGNVRPSEASTLTRCR